MIRRKKIAWGDPQVWYDLLNLLHERRSGLPDAPLPNLPEGFYWRTRSRERSPLFFLFSDYDYMLGLYSEKYGRVLNIHLIDGSLSSVWYGARRLVESACYLTSDVVKDGIYGKGKGGDGYDR